MAERPCAHQPQLTAVLCVCHLPSTDSSQSCLTWEPLLQVLPVWEASWPSLSPSPEKHQGVQQVWEILACPRGGEQHWQESTLGCPQDLQVLLAAQQWGLAVQPSPALARAPGILPFLSNDSE